VCRLLTEAISSVFSSWLTSCSFISYGNLLGCAVLWNHHAALFSAVSLFILLECDRLVQQVSPKHRHHAGRRELLGAAAASIRKNSSISRLIVCVKNTHSPQAHMEAFCWWEPVCVSLHQYKCCSSSEWRLQPPGD